MSRSQPLFSTIADKVERLICNTIALPLNNPASSPEKKRADPAVLRSLCSHTLPNGKNEVSVYTLCPVGSHGTLCCLLQACSLSKRLIPEHIVETMAPHPWLHAGVGA